MENLENLIPSEMEEPVNNDAEETTSTNTSFMDTLQETKALLKNAKEQIPMMESVIDNIIIMSDLSPNVKEKLEGVTEEDVASFNEEQLRYFFNLDKSETDTPCELCADEMRAIIKDIVEPMGFRNKTKLEIQKIQDDFDAQVKKQYDYLNSAEYAEKKAKAFSDLVSKYEAETDPAVKKKLHTRIEIHNAVESMSYLTKRIELNKDDEIRRLVDCFFDGNRSDLVVHKFTNAAKKMNIDKNIFVYFINLECKELPEEYHVFNNFFLFICMRYIAYVDVTKETEVLYAKNTLMNIRKLIYNEFPTEESKNKMLDYIKSFLDLFVGYTDRFKEDNISYHHWVERMTVSNEEEAPQDDEMLPEEGESPENAASSEVVGHVVDPYGNARTILRETSDQGFKLFIDGKPIIKPSETTVSTICYLNTNEDGTSEAIDTQIPIDQIASLFVD